MQNLDISHLRINRRKLRNDGFTIIELLIASAVFAVVLVGLMAAFIQISRIFYKGVNMSNTQNATRTITQDIENDLQFSTIRPAPFSDNYNGTAGNPVPHADYFCIGGHRYALFLGALVGKDPKAGVYRDDGCSPISPTTSFAASDQLLGSGMQLNSLGVDCGDASNPKDPPGVRCKINVHVVFYGGAGGSATGLFATNTQGYSDPSKAPDAECTGGLTSSQFCVTADYDRSVTIVGFTD